jgi:CubicO group peptidase (beta-lactamase class C family)
MKRANGGSTIRSPAIPEFAKLKVYAGDNPDGTLKLEDARRSMTMRELMTHTAGLATRSTGTTLSTK